MQGISDERGYQYQAGIHGLPLPMYCQHGTPLFLPWHRAYLYFFEKALQDQVAGVTLPWWDWSTGAIPDAYAAASDASGQPNPLVASPIQPAARQQGIPDATQRDPGGAGAPPLPTDADVTRVLAASDFTDFQLQLEDLHNQVHVWVGGTMAEIPVAAYDPIFWAHHCMIDRLWRLWQLTHPQGGPPTTLLSQALPPFPLTVQDTLNSETLGYDYAVATVAAPGPAG